MVARRTCGTPKVTGERRWLLSAARRKGRNRLKQALLTDKRSAWCARSQRAGCGSAPAGAYGSFTKRSSIWSFGHCAALTFLAMAQFRFRRYSGR